MFELKKSLTCLIGLHFAMPVYSIDVAENEQDTIFERSIDEFRVVAMRQRELVAPQRLSGQTLRQMNALSVADAVRYFAGVQIKDYGGVGGLKTVDVRSMGSNHLGVFYDGLQIGNAQNGTVDLGKFSLENVEEVAVYNGQKSDIFQPAKDFGTSGSVYLQTRRPNFSGDKRINASAKVSCGSFDLRNGSLLLETKITDNISYSANAEYTDASGKYKFRYRKRFTDARGNTIVAWDTTGVRQNGEIDALRLENSIFGSSDGAVWHLKAYYYKSARGLPRAIVRNVWTSSQRQYDRDFFVQGSLQKDFDEAISTKLNAKYSYDYMHYINPDTTLMYVDNTFRQYAVYASTANRLAVSDIFDIAFSADFERNWLKSDMANFALPKRTTLLAALAANLALGNVALQASLLGNFINDAASAKERKTENKTRKLTPAIFVKYTPTEDKKLSFSAFCKRMFRMPTFNDLYYTDIGNISLRPEYTTQFDLGVNELITRGAMQISLAADAYYIKVSDKILAVPKGNSQYRWMMMNIGKVDIRGAEARVGCKLPYVSCQLNYTYQRAHDVTDPTDNGQRGTYNGQISYIPEHSGSALVSATWHDWALNYSFIYVGERYHVSANIAENYEPSWYTNDLSLHKHLILNKILKFDLSFEVNNILDQQYDVVLNYPMPGRNYKGSVRISY
ncbi:MAG: TonB-dependent receptor plug domain-containing protein [Bacteroidales bacterium]|nr:TonB-dependent receptor plug domain-containing protein [Bacteroidales bacterium]